LAGSLDAVYLRHVDVHDYDVGPELAVQFYGSLAVFSLGDHLHAGLLFDQGTQAVPDGFVIVGKENFYIHGASVSCSLPIFFPLF
jgi:hypothetical protein